MSPTKDKTEKAYEQLYEHLGESRAERRIWRRIKNTVLGRETHLLEDVSLEGYEKAGHMHLRQFTLPEISKDL